MTIGPIVLIRADNFWFIAVGLISNCYFDVRDNSLHTKVFGIVVVIVEALPAEFLLELVEDYLIISI